MIEPLVISYNALPKKSYLIEFNTTTGQTRSAVVRCKNPEELEKMINATYIPMLAKKFRINKNEISYTYKEMTEEEYEKEINTKPH